MPDYTAKADILRQRLRELESVIIAFSGGVDSSLLAVVATEELGAKALCITATSPFHSQEEHDRAISIAENFNLNHRIVKTTEHEDEKVIQNPEDRCYHCKRIIFSALRELADGEEIEYIIDGTNVDDSGDFRPGRKALGELGIVSPLAECGLTKEEIRALSREHNLPTAELPSAACLASRVPYGERITPNKLKAIEAGEIYLREHGFPHCRVRHHGNLARIEVPAERIGDIAALPRHQMMEYFKTLGFLFVTVDLQGYRTGSLNEVISSDQKRDEISP